MITRTADAAAMMLRFAERTGVTSDRPDRRYLWTDAFAVCNFLGLARATGETRHSELALRLIERVHRTLGRHRPDDPRRGWISGLAEDEGARHPTRGGLRIGKKLPERRPDEPYDDRLEWDRDGQYFHYLTKWLHALDQAARETGTAIANVWARELAVAAHAAFVHDAPGGGRRIHWKMSIDLTRPLVPSMGQHDPLDGLVTFAEIAATASHLPDPRSAPSLESEIADFAAMIEPRGLATADPLGLGGLLTDAYRVDQLARAGSVQSGGLRDLLLASALAGLEQYVRLDELRAPAHDRLAFRELGLAIGLAAVEKMRCADEERTSEELMRGRPILDRLASHVALGERIVEFWLDPVHASTTTWTDHVDINEVMLATALAPDGFLVLRPVARS